MSAHFVATRDELAVVASVEQIVPLDFGVKRGRRMLLDCNDSPFLRVDEALPLMVPTATVSENTDAF